MSAPSSERLSKRNATRMRPRDSHCVDRGSGQHAGGNENSATKAAPIAIAKASSLDLSLFGITVNCIAPGPVATEVGGCISGRCLAVDGGALSRVT